ncbi:MAG: alpha/beta fold hydrolase [Alphaproteobacteria bacterium]|nr:alpha/beta fold hydrolase [Alphaproteobacteria bacterium]
MAEHRLADGASLYYETHGTGPALLLVPGLGGVAPFWQRHVPALARHFTVVLHDHRGCGRSTPSRIAYSVAQMADDLRQLMDGLGIAKAHLVGHSTGGAIGQVLALDHPDRIDRLVLSATWTHADAYFRRLFETRAEALRRLGAAFYGRLGNLVLYPPGWLARHADRLEAAQRASPLPATPDEIVLARIEALLAFDRRADLPRLRHRTLVMAARDDAVTPAYFSEALAAILPDARLVLHPTGGHFYNHVVQDEFERLTIGFLAGA